MIEAVLFDMDGLMFDTERMYQKAWLQAGRQMGAPMEPEIVDRLRGRNREGCARVCREAFGEDFDFDAMRTACRALMARWIEEDGLPVKPGLYELLAELERRGIPAVLATSTTRDSAWGHLQRAKVDRYFLGAVCGDEVSHSKPDPEVFLKAAALAGRDPARCMVLEDSPAGVRAGAAAGCFTVMVPDLTAPDEELKKLADEILPGLRDVIPLLDRD
ncbi:HAD family hydrolase [Allofournierella massiliensis]|uniref:HAD superfamily hydrolase (TIGR01509 family) n=1 Tax=Allofournierella massiliensis TaxID=1650663 RepID=A0A4R1R5I9_9FIRM|nr:HAD family phosphatase [Fournierella massiliensis]TCL60769.1 HAD superfamily hydrolase (TIGR01509 family) [Fournierella massiliensis]